MSHSKFAATVVEPMSGFGSVRTGTGAKVVTGEDELESLPGRMWGCLGKEKGDMRNVLASLA